MNQKLTAILVKAALSGQKDKAGVSKYEHCLRVAENASFLSKGDEDTIIVALLHDVLEDSDLEADDLIDLGYSEDIVAAVKLLTHYNSEGTYAEYVDKLVESGDLKALIAKLADNLDNNAAERLEYLDEKFKTYLNKRYAGVKEKLVTAILNLGWDLPELC